MHRHLDQGNGADPHVLEVVCILSPRASVGYGSLDIGIVVVECIPFRVNQLDIVVQLYRASHKCQLLYTAYKSLKYEVITYPMIEELWTPSLAAALVFGR